MPENFVMKCNSLPSAIKYQLSQNVEAVDLVSTVLAFAPNRQRSTDNEALAISRRSVGAWLWVRWRVKGGYRNRNGACQSFRILQLVKVENNRTEHANYRQHGDCRRDVTLPTI
jgi:hypothetical protein